MTNADISLSWQSIPEMSPLDVHALYKMRVDIFVAEQRCPATEIDAVDPLGSTGHLLARNAEGMIVGTARLFPSTMAEFRAEFASAIGKKVEDLEACEDPTDGAEGFAWHIGRLCVHPEHRHAGLGRALFTEAIDRADTMSSQHGQASQPIIITAQSHLTQYYESFGFSVCGPEFSWDSVPHFPMVR